MNKMIKKNLFGSCMISLVLLVMFILSTNFVSALRTQGTVAEASSVARLVGDTPYDIINQLDTKQIDLNHATQLASRWLFVEDYTSNKMVAHGFPDAHTLRGEFTFDPAQTLQPWTGGYDNIQDDLDQFQPNELFILESHIDPEDFGIYAEKISQSDKIYPKDVKSWQSTFAETNPLFLMNIEMIGLALPDQPNYIEELTRYSTIIAPKDVRSSELSNALLCNLVNKQRIGDIYRRARTKYYSTTKPSDQNMPGLILKSYSLYGNPLTRINVPEEYQDYIDPTNDHWYESDKWFNPCKNYFVPPDEYIYQNNGLSIPQPPFALQSINNDLKFENSINLEYNIIDVPDSDYKLINSSSLMYDYDNPNIVDVYTIRTHRLPKGSIVKKFDHSLSNPVDLSLPDYPSMESSNWTERNCFDSTQSAGIIQSTFEKDNYDEITVYLNPLEINDCQEGGFTLYLSAAYEIEYLPSNPFYFDKLIYDEITAPKQEVNLSFDLKFVSDETLNGELVVFNLDDNLTVYQKSLTTRVNNYSLSFSAPEKGGITSYQLQYLENNTVKTTANFDLETKIIEGQIQVGEFDGNSVDVELNLGNYLDSNLDVSIQAEITGAQNREVYNQDRNLIPGGNAFSFNVANLEKEDASYGLKIYITYNNQIKVFSDIIITNYEPVINAEDIAVRVGDLVNLSLDIYDPDGDEIQFDLKGADSFEWIAQESDLGQHNITITAFDGFLTSTKKILLVVFPENYEPVLDKHGNLTVHEGEVASIIFYATDIDGDNLTYLINNSDLNFTQLDNNWFKWWTQKGDQGDYIINYSVSDGTSIVSDSFQLAVVPAPVIPPAIFLGSLAYLNGSVVEDGLVLSAYIDDTFITSTLTENSQYNLTLPADDFETDWKDGGVDGDVVEVFVDGYPTDKNLTWQSGIVEMVDLIVQKNLTGENKTFCGNYSLDSDCICPRGYYQEEAEDDNGTYYYCLFNDSVNHAPFLNPIQDITLDEGEEVIIVAVGSDPDGDNLTYQVNSSKFTEYYGNLFTWLSQDGDGGVYTITVTVSDGQLADTQELLVTVNEVNYCGDESLDPDCVCQAGYEKEEYRLWS